ncbi:ATP-binding protein [Bifidobacterium sp. UTBIF-78]|uniref:ATP-binding protein n=1 Tax=Bifidobacterium sp. UTBIF-78 TaxID=1465263 RepID=UPI0011272CFA|nr:ATP-binding protein [Bifidobacterium sp. UTBIF-78]TPF94122.1 histidine kinase [Bifidobacterium sp. UTBIF-78]
MGQVIRFFDANGMVFELLITTLMFTWWLERRPGFTARFGLGMAALLVGSGLWRLLVPVNLWTVSAENMLAYVMYTVWIALCWRVNMRQAVFYFVMGGTLQHFVYRGARLASTWLHYFWEDASWIDTYVYALMEIPFFVIGYWCFGRPLVRKQTSALAGRSVLMLLFGMLLCISVFTNLFNAMVGSQVGSAAFGIFSAFDLVTCVFVMQLAIEIVINQVARSDGEVMRELLRQQKQQMAASKATIDLINVKTHDLKKQIASLGAAISDDQVRELSGLVDMYDASVRTGNETLDVLMAQKSMECEQQGICFDRMVDGSLLAFMNPVDLYSLFGNAIDNALEAVARLDAGEDRYISVRVRRDKGMAMIRVENPFAGDLTFEDGLPRTSKEDARYHGFGTRSMRMIAEQYDGTMAISARGGVFRLTVILPLRDADAGR